MAEKEFSLNLSGAADSQLGGWDGGLVDWGGNFVKSALYSIPELIGINPSPETTRWRAENPWSGFGSQLAGMAVPYAGWMRAARAIPALEALATGVKASELGTAAGEASYGARALANPFLTGAKAEAIRLAPFEIGRTLVSQAVGDQPLSEVATGAGINLALGAGISGGLSKLGALGRVAPGLRDIAPGTDETLAPQLILRELDKRAPTLPPEHMGELRNLTASFDERARAQVVPKGQAYVDSTIAGKGNEIERLFEPDAVRKGKAIRDGYVEVKRPVEGDHDYANAEGWQAAISRAGIAPEDVSRHMQFPRLIELNPAKAVELGEALGEPADFTRALKHSAWVERSVMKNLDPVGDGWYMKREPNDGMFVMAKKIEGLNGTAQPRPDMWRAKTPTGWKTFATREEVPAGSTNVKERKGGIDYSPEPGENDKWILFKTDSPGKFAKESQAVTNIHIARERWVVGAPEIENLKKSNDGSYAARFSTILDRLMPESKYLDMASIAGGVKNLGTVAEKLLPTSLKNSKIAQAGADFVRTYATPADRQFTKTVRGSYAHKAAKLIHDDADTHYQELFQGITKFTGNRAILAAVEHTTPPTGTAEGTLRKIWGEGLQEQFMRLHREGIGAEGAAIMASEGKISPRTAELAGELEGLIKTEHTDFNRVAVANGKSEIPWKDGSYGLRRDVEGDYWRILRNEAGDIIGFGDGVSPKAAAAKADQLAVQLRRETGRNVRAAEAISRTQPLEGLPADIRGLLRSSTGVVNGRQVRGYRWDVKTPTLNEVLDDVQHWMQGRARTMGTNMRDALLTRHQSALMVEDHEAARNLETRFNQMSGKEGELTKTVNRLTDKVLSPFGFGTNTATRLASATNTGLAHVTLGFFKIGAPLQNIIGTLQTIAPHAALLMNAPDSVVLRNFGMTMPAVGRGGVVGSISAVAPAKAMYQGLKAMMAPTAEELTYINRLLNDRVLGARVAENFIGRNRDTLRDWKGALTGVKPFIDFTLALSEWSLVHSEQFARTLSAMTAYRVLKNWHGITDPDALYMAGKRFVEKTNYLYGSADRPLVFTSPLGSSLGLFKNWQVNYMHMMAEYANLGAVHGVWSPLLWQTISTAAVAGAAGTPIYWLAEGASNFFKDKSLMRLAYDEWKDGADGVMFGLPAAITGVSLSSLMSSPGANPVRDATQLFSFAGWQRMKEAGGMVNAAMDNWRSTGTHPGSDPDVRNQLIKAFAPVLMQRAMAIDWDAGQIHNISTGLPSTKGLSTYDLIAYQAGLQPVAVERQMKVSDELYHDRERLKGYTKAFGDSLAEAFKAGNGAAADNILQRAGALGLDFSAILRSATMRGREELKTSAERLGKPADLAKYQNILP